MRAPLKPDVEPLPVSRLPLMEGVRCPHVDSLRHTWQVSTQAPAPTVCK